MGMMMMITLICSKVIKGTSSIAMDLMVSAQIFFCSLLQWVTDQRLCYVTAREELISYYRQLSDAADLRTARARWRIRQSELEDVAVDQQASTETVPSGHPSSSLPQWALRALAKTNGHSEDGFSDLVGGRLLDGGSRSTSVKWGPVVSPQQMAAASGDLEPQSGEPDESICTESPIVDEVESDVLVVVPSAPVFPGEDVGCASSDTPKSAPGASAEVAESTASVDGLADDPLLSTAAAPCDLDDVVFEKKLLAKVLSGNDESAEQLQKPSVYCSVSRESTKTEEHSCVFSDCGQNVSNIIACHII